MSIETPDGVLDVTNATLRVPQIEVQGTSVTTSLSTLSNVGVGTASPGGRLHVYGPDAKTLLQSTSNTANVEIGGPSGAIVDLKGPFTDDYDLRIQSSSDGGNLATTGNANHIRLASTSGYTGFGTSTPQYKIDVQGVKGIDAVSNPSAHNPVFLYDDQESTTTFSGTVGGTGSSRNTTSKYLELNSLADNVTGYVYWPIQMPNSWSAEFDHYVGGGDGGESLSFSFFNTSAPTTTGNHGGYRLAIAEFYGGAPAAKVVLYYQGSELAQKDIAGGIPTASWNKVVVNYNRGSISLSLNGRSVFSYEATENADSYTGRYVGFIGKTGLRDNYHRVRNVKCTSGTNWVYATGSNATTLAYLSGNVGIGTDVTTERLEISGNVKATHFVGDGGLLSNIATTLDAIVNQGNTTSNTVQFTNSNVAIFATGNIVADTGAYFVGDGSKLVNIPTDFESIIVNGNTTSNVVYFANTDVAIQASGNIVVDSDSFFIGNGGLLSNIATTLEDISNQGNTTSNTIQFTNSDVGFITTANVGIANSAPTNNLSIGSNVHVDDTGSNVLTVYGNVTANVLTLGAFGVVAAYGLNQVTAENNQTGDTLVLTNATKAIDAASNIELGGTLKFDSNVVITGGGAGTYVSNLRVANVASNIMTYDQSTGEILDSGGLISNKLAIVSEQPPSALTGATTTVSGHGKYVVTSSSVGTNSNAWNAFNGDDAVVWQTGSATYDGSDGTYAGSVDLGAAQTESGEWLAIEFPYKTVLRHVAITPGSSTASFPGTAYLYGTNDGGTTWTSLVSWSGITPSSTSDVRKFVVNASTSYKKYALVVNAASSASTVVEIGAFKLFTETFSVDAGKVNTTAASGLETGFTEHPLVAMTDYVTKSEFGAYEASASSFYNGTSLHGWKIFDRDTNTNWATNGGYDSSTGVFTSDATTTDVGGTRYDGHWVQIKTPYPIILSYSNVYPTNVDRSPVDSVILGSNDGDNWYKLNEFTAQTYSASTWKRLDVNATTPYQYYRMCVTKKATGDAVLGINEWRLFAEKDVTKFENVHISGGLSSETLQTGYIKWPRVPLKANESEGYVASASNVYATGSGFAAFNAFNDYVTDYGINLSPNWQGGVVFDASGDPTSGAASFDGMTGEWIQIQMPNAIALSYFTIGRRNDNGNSVNSGYMYGSNDGINWTKLVYFSGIKYSLAASATAFKERVDVGSTQTFNHYRLFVTKINASGGNYRVVLEELQLFEAATGVGAPPTSAKLQVHGSLGLAKGSSLYAGDNVVAEFPKHDRPLVKYPEVQLTGYSDGSGYVVDKSSEFDGSTNLIWEVFNDSGYGLFGRTQNGHGFDGTTTDHAYVGSTRLASDIPLGEYVTLALPGRGIKLSYFTIRARPNVESQAPEDFQLYGTNDTSSTWPDSGYELLASFSGQSPSDDYDTVFSVNSSKPYKKFGLVITRIVATSGACSIGDFKLYGTEEGDESVDVVHRSVPNKPGTQHLEVYWDANDSNSYSFADSSNVYDLSGNGVTATINGTNGFDAEYNAWVFDGSGDYISSSTTATFTTHTATMWIKFDTPAQWEGIYSIEPSTLAGRDNFALYVGDGYFRLESRGGTNGPYFDVTYDFKVGVWVHLTLIFRGTGLEDCEMYIDNTKLIPRGVSRSPSDDITITGTNTLTVGTQGAFYLDGSIANFRLFSKVLNADQIKELYDYEAARFGHREDVVALKNGNLGIGLRDPEQRLVVAGSLQEFPPGEMTSEYTQFTGHGIFRATASSYYDDGGGFVLWPYEAFGDPASVRWQQSGSNYNSSGTYTGSVTTSVDGQDVDGEWIQLELSTRAIIKRGVWNLNLGLSGSYDLQERAPKTFTIAGSNDGSTFYGLGSFSEDKPATTDYVYFDLVNSETAYKYVRFIGTSTHGGTSGVAVSLVYLRYYGVPQMDVTDGRRLNVGQVMTSSVGIGTTAPHASLTISSGSGTASSGTYKRVIYDGSTLGSGTGDLADILGIYSTWSILTNAYLYSYSGTVSASDRRIKENILDVEDSSALDAFRLLQPKLYNYRDVAQRGSLPVWGFIAQEVGDTLTYSTNKRTEWIPNVYELANVYADGTILEFDTTKLETGASKLRLYDRNDNEEDVDIDEVIDEYTVRLAKPIKSRDQVFVYGQEVTDFHFLKKDAIWTTAAAALQEVDRRQQADAAKIKALETKLAGERVPLENAEGLAIDANYAPCVKPHDPLFYGIVDADGYVAAKGKRAKVWVTNVGAPLSAGDIIGTTSNVAGYCSKLADLTEVPMHRAVGKVLVDVALPQVTDHNFVAPTVPRKRKVTETSNVTVWVREFKTSADRYATLGEDERRVRDEIYYARDDVTEVVRNAYVDKMPAYDIERYHRTQIDTCDADVYEGLPDSEKVNYVLGDDGVYAYTHRVMLTADAWSALEDDDERNSYVHGYFKNVTEELSESEWTALSDPAVQARYEARTRPEYFRLIVARESRVGYTEEVRVETVDVLDAYGRPTYEDVEGETDPAFEFRYLTAEGVITDRHSGVHMAALVECLLF